MNPRPVPLSPAVTVERLPLLGTSWYQRGPTYWLRRAMVCALCAIALLATVAMTAWALAFVWAGGWLRLALALMAAGVAVLTAWWYWRNIYRPITTTRDVQLYRGTRWMGLTLAAITIVALLVHWYVMIAGVLYVVGALVNGPMVVTFVRSFAPILGIERQAWDRLEARR